MLNNLLNKQMQEGITAGHQERKARENHYKFYKVNTEKVTMRPNEQKGKSILGWKDSIYKGLERKRSLVYQKNRK